MSINQPSNNRLIKVLFRSFLKWNRKPHIASSPFKINVDAFNLRSYLPAEVKDLRNAEGVQAAIYHVFRYHPNTPAALDDAFRVLKELSLLETELKQNHFWHLRNSLPEVQQFVEFHIGQVVQHKEHGYRGVVVGWRVDLEQGLQHVELLVDTPDIKVSAKAPRLRNEEVLPSSNYRPVKVDSLLRISNELLSVKFKGFDANRGEYVPNDELAFRYPIDCAHLYNAPKHAYRMDASGDFRLDSNEELESASNEFYSRLVGSTYNILRTTRNLAQEMRVIIEKNGFDFAGINKSPHFSNPSMNLYSLLNQATGVDSDKQMICASILDDVIKNIAELERLTAIIDPNAVPAASVPGSVGSFPGSTGGAMAAPVGAIEQEEFRFQRSLLRGSRFRTTENPHLQNHIRANGLEYISSSFPHPYENVLVELSDLQVPMPSRQDAFDPDLDDFLPTPSSITSSSTSSTSSAFSSTTTTPKRYASLQDLQKNSFAALNALSRCTLVVDQLLQLRFQRLGLTYIEGLVQPSYELEQKYSSEFARKGVEGAEGANAESKLDAIKKPSRLSELDPYEDEPSTLATIIAERDGGGSDGSGSGGSGPGGADRSASHLHEYPTKYPRPSELDFETSNPQVKFQLGQVVRHIKFDFRGVISGWDQRPNANVSDSGIKGLPSGLEQPFYRVIPDESDLAKKSGEDQFRSFLYVAQENLLEVANPNDMNVQHRHMQHFFQGFNREVKRFTAPHKLRFCFPNVVNTHRDVERTPVQTVYKHIEETLIDIFSLLSHSYGGTRLNHSIQTVSKAKPQDILRFHERLSKSVKIFDDLSVSSPQNHDFSGHSHSQSFQHSGANNLAFAHLNDVAARGSHGSSHFGSGSGNGNGNGSSGNYGYQYNLAQSNREVLHFRYQQLLSKGIQHRLLLHTPYYISKTLAFEDLLTLLRTASAEPESLSMSSILFFVSKTHFLTDVNKNVRLGISYTKRAKFDLAIDCYTRAIRADPFFSAVLSSLGAVYYKYKEHKKATSLATASIFAEPENYEAWAEMGLSQELQGDIEGAINSFSACLNINPWWASLSTTLNFLLLEQERAAQPVLGLSNPDDRTDGLQGGSNLDDLDSVHFDSEDFDDEEDARDKAMDDLFRDADDEDDDFDPRRGFGL